MERYNILGTNINVTNIEDTVNKIVKDINNIKGEYICVSNVHTIVMGTENQHYKDIQNNSYMSLPDGKPLSMVINGKNPGTCRRVTGPDIMERLFEVSEKEGYSHYFYGSTEETLELLMKSVTKKHPKLRIAGAYSPPFRPLKDEEEAIIIKEINSIKPDILWVGLGAPKQEIWMHNHRNKIDSLMIGVGAGFDYHAGKIKRAPKWIQNLSLEWFFRLLQEPKRLWKRYLYTNIKFLYLLFKG